jgi:competence protein ComEA
MKTLWPMAFGVVFGLLAAGVLLLASRQPVGEVIQLSPPPTPSPLIVHVSGSVIQPGVYTFPQSGRVQDAIQAAGGFLPEADDQALNLAAPLQDGQLIRVPLVQPKQAGPAVEDQDSSRSLPVLIQPDDRLVNINYATLEELDTLPGIGPVTAQKIIDFREANGPFISIEAIQDVSGIGPATFGRIKDLISVNTP